MKRLIAIEFEKLRHYRAFWLLLGAYLLVLIGSMIGFDQVLQNIVGEISQNGAGFGLTPAIGHFPDIWVHYTYMASFLNVIFGALIIILTCNEYSNKTLRQNLINGLRRSEFFWSKMLTIVWMCMAVAVLCFLSILVMGLLNSTAEERGALFKMSIYAPTFFLQLLGYSTIAFFWANLIRKQGFTIGIFFLQAFMVENILFFAEFDEHLWPYFLPIKSMDNMIVLPVLGLLGRESELLPMLRQVVATGIYIMLFGGGSWFLIWRRDH